MKFVVDVQVDDVFVASNKSHGAQRKKNNKSELRLTFHTVMSHRHKMNDL